MSNLMLIAHALFIIVISFWSYYIAKEFKIPITIHNLPIILLVGLGLCVAAWAAAFKPMYFIPTGVLCGFVVFGINLVKIPGHANPSIIRNMCMSLFCTLFWPEMVVLFWIASKNFKNEKPQH